MSMADRDGFIWYDGKLVPWRDATTHVLTHSLHYGLAVFEGVRAYKTVNGTAIFRLKEHTDRLFNSAHIYTMPMPYDKETLMEAQKEVVRANKLESCYLRPIAFYGSEKMGVSPKGAKTHVAIAAWPWGAYLGEEGMEKGIRVKTSSLRPPPRQRHDGARQVSPAPTPTRSSPTWKRPSTATTRRCCSTSTASSPKARARTCSSSRTARSTNPRSPRR